MSKDYKNELSKRTIPLSSITSLEPLIEKLKDKKVVMLGESTHGTAEFYEWRRKISMELIQNHGFKFIAVEGDWPACQEINQQIQSLKREEPIETLKAFNRWPTWMWGNEEVTTLMEELWRYNLTAPSKVGFHGLDIYSLYESISVLLNLVGEVDPLLARKVADIYACFEPYRQDEMSYARSLFSYPAGCEAVAMRGFESSLAERLKKDPDYLNVIQNARIVKNAENFYRAMVEANDSWNVRDRHMLDTLDMLLEHYGPNTKGIVWAHNTHIGDYRATNMIESGSINLGGLAREKYGEDHIALVGLTTYRGSVIASKAWDGPIMSMPVPKSPPGTLEEILHEVMPEAGSANFYVVLDKASRVSALADVVGHRAIGVVYQPQFELGNYVPTSLANRYDALIYFDETVALTPYQVKMSREKLPDTYPFGSRM